MTRGDRILVAIIALTVVGLVVDRMGDGVLGQWVHTHLASTGQTLGQFLGWTGWALSPLVLVPLIAALVGRFMALPGQVEALLKRAAVFIDQVSITVADMARWAALGLVIVTAIVVIQRYVFGVSSTKLQESVIYLHALLFLLSSAATLLFGGHVRVDIIYSKLSERGKAWTDLIGVYIALIPMCWLILDTSQSYVGGAWRILERSRESNGLPLIFLLKTAIPIFAVMMILQGLSMASRSALVISGRTPPPTGEDHGKNEL